jgi:hypothetical protein
MASRNAYRLTNESANQACSPAADIWAADASPARAASPAARPSHDVNVAAGSEITLARNTSRQLSNRQSVLVSHDTRSRNCAWRPAFKRLRPPFLAQKESVVVSRLHIYIENSETGRRGLLFRAGRGAW